MFVQGFKVKALAAGVGMALLAGGAQASHFRGAAVVPTVSASGVLDISAKTYWRKSASDGIPSLSITGPNGFSQTVSRNGTTNDFSDVRRDEEVSTFQTTLTGGAGLYTMSWGSFSWVSGVPNASGSFGTTSTIFWDGQTANTGIQFDLANIQQEVVRGTAYSDNLDAIGSTALTYDDTFLSSGMSSQAPGYSVDASGQITMSAATTAAIADNASNAGADVAFSGKINAADGSSVEYVWLFDAVQTGSNLAPQITDLVINALVGDVINETLTVTDPNGDPTTTSFVSFIGPGGSIAGSLFNPGSLNFQWDSAGFAPGTYIATFSATDGSLTDQGTIRINLTQGSTPPPTTGVPVPGALLLLGAGLAAFGVRRKAKR